MGMSQSTVGKRAERPRKPVKVPLVIVVIGVAIFFLGIGVASVDVSALGALLFFWGLSSSAVLMLTRRRRARNRAMVTANNAARMNEPAGTPLSRGR